MGVGSPNLFAHHSRSWRDNRYVYPVVSRRSRGLSIGINVNPDKACNFGCVYCCVDRTTPPAARKVDLAILRQELDHLLGLALSRDLFASAPFDATPLHLRRVNDIAFSGDGEPTSYPGFDQACRLVADVLRQHHASDGQVKIVIITNATLLHRPTVREALSFLDDHHGEIWAKLDAGTEGYYQTIERTHIPLSRVLDNIRDAGRVRPIAIQSLFLELHGCGPSDAEIDAYLTRLRELTGAGCRIKHVQVYTIARRTAVTDVAPLPDARIDQIVEGVRQLGLPADGFYGTR